MLDILSYTHAAFGIITALMFLAFFIVLYDDYKKKKTVTLWYWAVGFGFFSFAVTLNLINQLYYSVYLVYSSYVMLSVACIYYFMVANRLVLIEEKKAIKFSRLFFALYVGVSIISLPLSIREWVAVQHAFLIPSYLLFAVYFLRTYYVVKIKWLFSIAVMWVLFLLFAIGQLVAIFTYGFDSYVHNIIEFILVIVLFMLSRSYVPLLKHHEELKVLLNPNDYYFGEGLVEYVEQYLHEATQTVLKKEFDRLSIKNIRKALPPERQKLVDNLMEFHLNKLISIKKQGIVHSHILMRVGIRTGMTGQTLYSVH